MKTRARLKVCVLLLSLLSICSCGFSGIVMEIPNLREPRVYDAVWEASMSQALNMGYTLVSQDKQRGEQKFVQEIGKNEYQIRVGYGTIEKGKPGAVVEVQQKDLINPFVSDDAKKIEDAIKKAASSL